MPPSRMVRNNFEESKVNYSWLVWSGVGNLPKRKGEVKIAYPLGRGPKSNVTAQVSKSKNPFGVPNNPFNQTSAQTTVAEIPDSVPTPRIIEEPCYEDYYGSL